MALKVDFTNSIFASWGSVSKISNSQTNLRMCYRCYAGWWEREVVNMRRWLTSLGDFHLRSEGNYAWLIPSL